MKNKKYKYLKLLDLIQNLVRAKARRYNSKFSNRIFDNWQHIVLQVFRQLWRNTYREFVAMLEFSQLAELLNLKRIPHFTTLQKFAKRTSSMLLGFLICNVVKMLKPVLLQIAIDSTGFSLDHASHHYVKRIGRKKPIKGFVKLSAATCVASGSILAVRVRKHPAHDNKDFRSLLNKIHKPISLVVADKAYDAEKNHEFVREKLRAESVIPLRKNCGYKIHGRYRKLLSKQFPEKKYAKRSNVESVFSAVKRRLGSTLMSRTFRTQRIELLSRILAFNCEKLVSYLAKILKGFYKAVKIEKEKKNKLI